MVISAKGQRGTVRVRIMNYVNNGKKDEIWQVDDMCGVKCGYREFGKAKYQGYAKYEMA